MHTHTHTHTREYTPYHIPTDTPQEYTPRTHRSRHRHTSNREHHRNMYSRTPGKHSPREIPMCRHHKHIQLDRRSCNGSHSVIPCSHSIIPDTVQTLGWEALLIHVTVTHTMSTATIVHAQHHRLTPNSQYTLSQNPLLEVGGQRFGSRHRGLQTLW